MQDFYSAKELAGVGGLPTTVQGVRKAALKLGWVSQKRQGTKALEYAFSSLPADVQITFRKAATKQLLTVNSLPETRKEVQLGMFETQQQALVADARKGVLNALNGLMQTTGYTQTKCAELLIDMARAEQVEPYMIAMLKSARDGRGRTSVDGLPSARSLLRFVERSQAGELTPIYRQKDMSVPVWAKEFLSYYASPEKRSVQHSYEMFQRTYEGELPSIWQVRRFLNKMGSYSRQVGRLGHVALLAEKGFVRRDVSDLNPTSVYSADGHKFDAEVQHPAHGRPFRPEITSIIDVKTRKLVGWSIDLAESALAVLDAVRHASVTNGICAIFYVDNGTGYKNAMMNDEAVGLMGRLGCHMTHSIPYRSQSRGGIERSHKTIWVKAAKELPGYIGKDMDREAAQKMHKLTRKAIKETEKPVKMPLIGWQNFIDFCKAKAAEYNDSPHSFLPKITDASGTRRHMSPNECWQQHVDDGFVAITITDDEARPLFRPQVMRTLQRCEIDLFTNKYYAPQLLEHNGEEVRIAYDIHDVEKIWIYNNVGVFLGTGELNGNKKSYFPKSFVEQKEDERLDGRTKRMEAHLEEAYAERHGTAAIAHDSIELPGLGILNMSQLRARAEDIEHAIDAEFEPVATATVTPISAPESQSNPVPSSPDERWQLWNAIDQGQHDLNEQGERIAHWFTTYPHSKEFIAFARRHGAAVASY